MGINNEVAMTLTGKKLESSIQAGADFICTACPYCQIQFDTVQYQMYSDGGIKRSIPSILYPQLIGICMGIENEELGINKNLIDVKNIRSFLSGE